MDVTIADAVPPVPAFPAAPIIPPSKSGMVVVTLAHASGKRPIESQ
jgi:hypothetical protein